MSIATHPVMALPGCAFQATDPPGGVEIRIIGPDADLASLHAVAHVSFGAPGTDVGADDDAAVEVAERAADPGILAFTQGRIRDGFTVMAGAWIGGRAVASGSYQPVDGIAEITGIATLPALRRRGIATALTSTLVEHALAHGVEGLFLSADDANVARVYGRLGFVEVGTAGAAFPAAG